MRLGKSFYCAPTLDLAVNLLGTFLVHESQEGKTVGRVVETEAYLCDDPACHASRGKTPRNSVMFGKPGHAYIYFVYGMHYCFNVVSGVEGKGEAVLIRALEPIEGIDLMQRRRRTEKVDLLCKGPARLVEACGITKEQNGISLLSQDLYFMSKRKRIANPAPFQVGTTTRIGISKGSDLPYRFFINDNKFISVKKTG